MSIITRWSPPKHPWERADLDTHELAALKAIKDGVASKEQQQLALRTILVKIARTYDMSFRPGGSEGDRATQFAEGMRSVGTAIIEACDRPMKPSGDKPDASAQRAADRRNPKPERPKSKPAKPTTPER